MVQKVATNGDRHVHTSRTNEPDISEGAKRSRDILDEILRHKCLTKSTLRRHAGTILAMNSKQYVQANDSDYELLVQSDTNRPAYFEYSCHSLHKNANLKG